MRAGFFSGVQTAKYLRLICSFIFKNPIQGNNIDCKEYGNSLTFLKAGAGTSKSRIFVVAPKTLFL